MPSDQPRYVADDDPDAEGPFVTKSGRVLSDADIERMVEEAERGYDIRLRADGTAETYRPK